MMSEEPDEMIDTFNETYEKNDNFFGHPYRELQDHFRRLKKKGSVLDVGSGQGRDTLFLASIGFDVTAIDKSTVGIEQMLSRAREMDLEIEGIAGDALTVQIEDKFDIILFDMLLHSFDKADQMKILDKYSKNLHDDGKFCIIFPDDMEKEYFLDLLRKIDHDLIIHHESVVYDVPKIDGMESDDEYMFYMITIGRA